MALEMLRMGLLSSPSLQVVLDKDLGGVMAVEQTLGPQGKQSKQLVLGLDQ